MNDKAPTKAERKQAKKLKQESYLIHLQELFQDRTLKPSQTDPLPMPPKDCDFDEINLGHTRSQALNPTSVSSMLKAVA